MGRPKKPPPPSFATDKGTWDRNHYVMFFDDQLDSPAFTALSAHAKVAYLILRQEYKGPYSGNKVICPYSTFREKGMRGNTVSRALLMLEVYGFVRIDHGGLEHIPNTYHFIEDWKKIKTEDDLKFAEAKFREELDKKHHAKERVLAAESEAKSPRHGNYISRNESVTYTVPKEAEIDNESDSWMNDFYENQITEPLPAQVWKPLTADDMPLILSALPSVVTGLGGKVTKALATERAHKGLAV